MRLHGTPRGRGCSSEPRNHRNPVALLASLAPSQRLTPELSEALPSVHAEAAGAQLIENDYPMIVTSPLNHTGFI